MLYLLKILNNTPDFTPYQMQSEMLKPLEELSYDFTFRLLLVPLGSLGKCINDCMYTGEV